jgi:sec-independent protein translocase protein TatA
MDIFLGVPGLPGLGPTELILILVIALVIFGGGKLATVGKQLGEGIRNFKSEVNTAPKPLEGPADQAELPRDVTDEHRTNRT